MTRRKAKKAFKKKWNAPGRIAVFHSVPRGLSPRLCDNFNTKAEKRIKETYFKALDDLILYGSGGKRTTTSPSRSVVPMLVDQGAIPAAVGEIVTREDE